MATDIPFSDYLEIHNLIFQWSESYDTKNWELLRQLLAPSIRLDFRGLHGALHDQISPDEYVAILSDTKLIGDQRLKTQHLVGASKWERMSDGAIEVVLQLRVAHQRYTADDLQVVENKGHAHGFATHRYRKFEGPWKLESVAAQLEWSEYDLLGTLNPKEGS